MEKILWELTANSPSSFHVGKFIPTGNVCCNLHGGQPVRTEVLAPAYGASCTSLLMYWGIALGSLKRLLLAKKRIIDSLMRNGPAFMAFHAIAW